MAGYDYTAYYYDDRGRIVQTRSTNALGGTDVEYVAYNFVGDPVKRRRVHTATGKPGQTEVYSYTYDHAGRLLTTKFQPGSGPEVTLVSCTYDDLGRLKTRTPHGIASAKLTYSYNLRGWLTAISGSKFSQNLYYNTGNGTPCYNGNISSMSWQAGGETTLRGYKFTYDGLNRMLDAVYGEGTSLSSNANRFTEKVTGYDKNGNILALQRYGQTGASSYGLIDNLTFTLNGNQLNRVDDAVTGSAYNGGFEFKDAVKQANEYAYDANGNLTKDLNKNISNIQYNSLNLPSKVTFTDGSTIEYTYAADGTKLKVVHKIGSMTTTTDYCGNVIYENGVQKLLLTEAGYLTLADSKYHYYLQDHQGNNRVVIDQNGIAEEVNHYYPFGGVFANSTSVQPYKYNGKELDTKKGLNWYDYGARHYDAALGRFATVDPMAEKYYSWSPYTYCLDNPIKYIDPNGCKIVIGTFWQRFFGLLGLNSYVSKVQKQIEQNNKISTEFSDIYKKLEESDLVYHILPVSESAFSTSGNHVLPESEVKVGKKQGATLYYDPDMYKTKSGRERNPRVALAHEFSHLYDLLTGEQIPLKKQKKKKGEKGYEEEKRKIDEDNKEIKEQNEKNAIELENIIRKLLNESTRNEYFIKQ